MLCYFFGSRTLRPHDTSAPHRITKIALLAYNYISRGGRGRGQACPRRHFPGGGISRKIKNFRPVYGHLNASQTAPNSSSAGAPLHSYARWGAPHTFLVGWDRGKEGRQDERLPRAPQTFAPPLLRTFFYTIHARARVQCKSNYTVILNFC